MVKIYEKKCFKALVMGVVLCCMMWISGINVNAAQSVNEVEPNNSIGTAQLIQANSELPAQALTGNRPNQYVVNGSTKINDEDWYMVFLTPGTQYVTCNTSTMGASLNFEVYDANGNIIMSESYTKQTLGSTGHPFTVASAGNYYVKFTGTRTSLTHYSTLIGGPTYVTSGCTVNFGSIPFNNADIVRQADLSFLQPVFPEGAIIHSIAVRGVTSTNVNGISVSNLTRNITINLPNYTYNQTGLLSRNMEFANEWEVTLRYKKNVTVSPSLELQFVYPLTSQAVEPIDIN